MTNITRFPVPAADEAWRALLLENDKGYPKPLLANAITAFRHHPHFKGIVAFDEFRVQTMILSPTPWDNSKGWRPRPWEDIDGVKAAEWLQHQDVCVKPNVAEEAIEAAAREARFHPVRDYLNRLVWDGTPRVGKWLTYYCGTVHTPYTSAVGRCFLISAVARVMRPGCKADNMPIFEGPQDLGKSTVARILGDPWFTDEMSEFGSTDAAMQMRGVWIVEIAELDAMSKSSALKTKAFITRRTDRFRPPYGRRVIEQPRQCVFIGTTNQDAYLKDPTGGRRFWPVELISIDTEGLRTDRDQLWAEAVHLFNAGTPWWLVDAAEINAANMEQMDRHQDDPWQAIISRYLHSREETSTLEILGLVLDIPEGKRTKADEMRVAECIQVFAKKEEELPWKRGRGPADSTGYRPPIYQRQGRKPT